MTEQLQAQSTAGSSSNGGGGSAGVRGSGPGGAEGLAAHPNMHYDTQAGKWMYENAETGQEYEWNTTANAWLPVLDGDMLEAQQKAYSVQGVDEAVSRSAFAKGPVHKLIRTATKGAYKCIACARPQKEAESGQR